MVATPAEPIVLAGTENCGWLKMLKNSARNRTFLLSVVSCNPDDAATNRRRKFIVIGASDKLTQRVCVRKQVIGGRLINLDSEVKLGQEHASL